MESMFSVFLSSLSFVFHPTTLFIMIIGLVVGIIGGMIPGITTVTAIALFIPFTFSMPPTLALAALGAVYCGAMYGGANAAILINTPGAPGSIATALDGYPMTLKGRAPEALFMALLASCFGGFVGAVMLLDHFLCPEWIGRVLPALCGVRQPGYYAQMAVAWALSVCYVKFPEETLPWLRPETLEPGTLRKTLQKILESRRLDEAGRETIRRLRAQLPKQEAAE